MAGALAARRRWFPELESPPVKVEIVDVEKRKGVSKYYLYIMVVTRTNGQTYTIRRRYRQFNELQTHLDERFLVEAGSINSKDRILPSLPGKIYFGRSAVRDVTDQRLPALNEYLKKLYALPDNIRYDSIVMAFVRPTSEDQAAQSSSQPRPPRHSPSKPQRPAVGPTPRASARQPSRPPPPHVPQKRSVPPLKPAPPSKPTTSGNKGPRAKTLYAYTGQFGDELTFPVGVTIALTSQVNGDWYMGVWNGDTGLVPRNYLQVIQPPVIRDPADTVQDSDEWEDSDTETGRVTFYFNGAARVVEVDPSLVERPTLSGLKNAIQRYLHREGLVLNYKDSSGDVVEMTEQKDIELMVSEGLPPPKLSEACHAPWSIYVTEAGDYKLYNTHPYPHRR